MHDNACAHSENLIDKFLESGDTEQISWSAKSPNFNSTQNSWDYLEKAVAQRHPLPRDVNVLKTTMLGEWNFIP